MSEWVAVLATERGGIRSKYQSRTQSEFADQVHPGVMVGCGALKENEFKHTTSAVAAGKATLPGTQLLLLPVRLAVAPSISIQRPSIAMDAETLSTLTHFPHLAHFPLFQIGSTF